MSSLLDALNERTEDDCTQVDEVRPDLESATENEGRAIALAVLLFIGVVLLFVMACKWAQPSDECKLSAECMGRFEGTIR